MSERPKLNNEISEKDFKAFYWLKEELIQFCRAAGLKTSGGKIEISNRIAHFLKTGNKQVANTKAVPKPKSKFDWNNEILSLETILTDNYKNTENVRSFFEKQLGKPFKFNVRFMNWMKVNAGKTLGDAIKQWKAIKLANKNNTGRKDIAPQFEYNRYLRDFLADNPELSRADGIELWKLKKTKRGDNVYKREDLNNRIIE